MYDFSIIDATAPIKSRLLGAYHSHISRLTFLLCDIYFKIDHKVTKIFDEVAVLYRMSLF